MLPQICANVVLQVTLDDTNDITIDVDNEQPEQMPGFETYRSLLDRHPFLRANSRRDSSSVDICASSPSASSTASITDIDLKPLKQAAVLKYLSDNTRQVCQYELPGGGECRDKSCENVHLSRISAVEPSGTSVFTLFPVANLFIVVYPSLCLCAYRLRLPTFLTDEDTAQYLCSSIPGGQRYGVEVFRKALDVARLSHPNISLDARVQVALTRLGLR